MKKIVLNASDLIDLADVSDYAKVGIRWDGGKKCVIIRTTIGFCGLDPSLEIINSWTRETMQDYIKAALRQGGTEAFYFNKTSDLFKWMSE